MDSRVSRKVREIWCKWLCRWYLAALIRLIVIQDRPDWVFKEEGELVREKFREIYRGPCRLTVVVEQTLKGKSQGEVCIEHVTIWNKNWLTYRLRKVNAYHSIFTLKTKRWGLKKSNLTGWNRKDRIQWEELLQNLTLFKLNLPDSQNLLVKTAT